MVSNVISSRGVAPFHFERVGNGDIPVETQAVMWDPEDIAIYFIWVYKLSTIFKVCDFLCSCIPITTTYHVLPTHIPYLHHPGANHRQQPSPPPSQTRVRSVHRHPCYLLQHRSCLGISTSLSWWVVSVLQQNILVKNRSIMQRSEMSKPGAAVDASGARVTFLVTSTWYAILLPSNLGRWMVC